MPLLGKANMLLKQDGAKDVPRKLSICSSFVSVSSLRHRESARIVIDVAF